MSTEELGPNDKLPFGKHKGQTVADVLKLDPGWLAWLRAERQVQNRQNFFTKPVDDQIKKQIKTRAPKASFPPRLGEDSELTKSASDVTKTAFERVSAKQRAEEERAEAYKDQWGEW